MLPPSSNRQHLRQQLRHARRALTAQQQTKAAQQLCWKLAVNCIFRKAKKIAFYLPNDGEISPLPLLQIARRRGQQIYLPRLSAQGFKMQFVRYLRGDRLYKNRFNIPQPGLQREAILPRKLDIIFLPLVGFDGEGNRLGMGGGFYDRALKRLKMQNTTQLIGLAHQCQKVAHIPTATWDIPLRGIATDKHLYRT